MIPSAMSQIALNESDGKGRRNFSFLTLLKTCKNCADASRTLTFIYISMYYSCMSVYKNIMNILLIISRISLVLRWNKKFTENSQFFYISTPHFTIGRLCRHRHRHRPKDINARVLWRIITPRQVQFFSLTLMPLYTVLLFFPLL